MSDLKPMMVRLRPDYYEKLRRVAFNENLPPATLARLILSSYLDHARDPMEVVEEEIQQQKTMEENTLSNIHSPVIPPGTAASSRRRRKKKKKGR